MWWLFVRDFYAASAIAPHAAPARATAHAVAQSPVPAQTPASFEAPAADSYTTMHDNAAPEAGGITNLTPYLQRLSVDGEHAFGLWDSDAGFSVFSANFERVSGLSAARCAGHDWIGSIHHQQQYAMNEALIVAEREGIAGQCLVQARSSEDGEWNWLVADVKPPSARQSAVMVLWRNVSSEHVLEEALKQSESALAMAERGRSAFLSSMSHELRTPLNAIMGFSQMMKSGVFGAMPNSTYQQYAEHIHDSGKLLLGKVNDLLDIASLDSDGIELEEERCNVRNLLAETVEIHSHAAFARHQSLRLDCTQMIEVHADRAKLICVLSHFVSNALRHAPNNSEISLAARVCPQQGLVLSVRDQGEGIAPAQLEIIRDALQAESASYFQIEPGGIGLGLSLARELAACHDGRVMVDSIRHRGTVVSVILPPERVVAGMPKKSRRTS